MLNHMWVFVVAEFLLLCFLGFFLNESQNCRGVPEDIMATSVLIS